MSGAGDSSPTRRELLAAPLVLGAVASAGARSRAGAAPATPATSLALVSLADAALGVREGRVSSLELVELLLRRIEQHNPRLNAVVTVRADAARARAREADAARARGESWGPLHGVPITIKDTFEIAGVRTTAGAPFLADHVPAADAVAVARLRAAGAVLLAKDNVPLLASDWQSDNAVFGRSNNPWDLLRTPGGSTGGGAAAVAAGLSYLTLGSDIGGSIRIPAAFCGIFGHKPSLHLVPLAGHIPPLPGTPPGPAPELPVAGPLARSAADLDLALSVLAGPMAPENVAYRLELPPPRQQKNADYRLGFVIDDPFCRLAPEVRAVLERALETLRQAGFDLRPGWPEGVDPFSQLRTYEYILAQEIGMGYTEELKQIVREQGKNDPRMKLWAQAIDANIAASMAVRSEQAQARRAWRLAFRQLDGFLMPATFVPAVLHDPSEPLAARRVATSTGERRYDDLLRWISFATLTGNPATVLPAGRTAQGLPVGLQVMGPFLEDRTPIDLAGRLAEVLGGFTPPPGFA